MKRVTIKQRLIIKSDIFLSVLLFLLTFFVRLPLFHTNFWRTPDAVEYINVAKLINSNFGLTQSIKWHFFDSYPVVTSALHGKPIFTSIIFSLILRIHNDVYILQIFTFVLMSFVCLVAYILARKFFTPLPSFFLVLLIAINPNILITNRLILSEPLFYLFVLLAFFMYYSNNQKENIYKIISIGVFSSLAYLVRSEGLFLIAIFAIFYIKNLKYLLVLFLSFFVIAAPYFYLNFKVNGNFLYSYTINHFRVKNFSDVMWQGYLTVFPTPWSFVTSNTAWIVHSVISQFIINIKSLLAFPFFGLLSLAFLLVKIKDLKQFLPFILFGFLMLINFTVFWSAFSDPERHLSLMFMVLLFPLFKIVHRSGVRKFIFILLVFISLSIYIPYDLHRITWARTEEKVSDAWSGENKKEMYDWVRRNTERNDIIASPNPWLVNLNTERPSILYPTNISDRKKLSKFLMDYNVEYIIVDQKSSRAYGLLEDAYHKKGIEIMKRIETSNK